MAHRRTAEVRVTGFATSRPGTSSSTYVRTRAADSWTRSSSRHPENESRATVRSARMRTRACRRPPASRPVGPPCTRRHGAGHAGQPDHRRPGSCPSTSAWYPLSKSSATMAEMEALRGAGHVRIGARLAYQGHRVRLEVWAEWTHEQDRRRRGSPAVLALRTVRRLPTPTGAPCLPEGLVSTTATRIVQWETPIPPRRSATR